MREEQTTKERTMKVTKVNGQFSMEELGEQSNRETLIKMIADAPKGGIIHVHAYESKGGHGEVANYFYLKGVDYGRMKERSLAKLDEIANDDNFSITVTRGVWTDKEGVNHNRKAKDRAYRVITETYTTNDPIFADCIEEIKQSILNPHQKGAEYDKEGNGVYSQENGSLHIRDCQVIHKTVLREGDYPLKATSENVALRNAIKRNLPISKYRQVCLDGRFDYISVGGQIIMQDENENDIYVGFAEHKGLLTPRIHGLTETLESVSVPTETLTPEPLSAEVQELLEAVFGE